MKRILTAVVLVPLVLLVVFKAPLWLFALFVALVAALGLHEYLNIIRACGIEPLPWATHAMSLLVVAGVFAAADPRLLDHFVWSRWLFQCWTILLLLPLVFGIPVIFRPDLRMALPASAASAFGVLYIGVSLALLVSLRSDPLHNILVVFILFSVWAGDTAAYYVGRTLGRNKLAPTVSPNKTWEGAAASVLASVGVAALVFYFQQPIRLFFSGQEFALADRAGPPPPIPWAHIVSLGILSNVAAQLGDLFESAMKRGARVKDSGSLLPGHGGLLDRIDALLFAIPVVWYYANLTGFLEQSVFNR